MIDENKKLQMFGYMSTFEDDSLPDGAWQATLEWAAEDWGEMEGVSVDGFEAFMEYVKHDH